MTERSEREKVAETTVDRPARRESTIIIAADITKTFRRAT
jgi:hypothetical protein